MEGIISFDEWQKLDLRVGQIVEVEDIEGADKLYKLVIDIGSEKRIVCAGLKEYYSKEDLMNKKIILFVNLAPRKMRGIESQGMILAAVNSAPKDVPSVEGDINTEGNESKVRLLQPDGEIDVGSRVM